MMTIERFSLWAPEKETLKEWQKWDEGESPLIDSPAPPALPFAKPIVYRRFSQITRMTCLLAHRLGLDTDNFFFSSIRGEIRMQYRVNADYATFNELKPAHFSLSVFNTPPAQATILLSSKTPYTSLFSGKESVIRNLTGCARAFLKAKGSGSVLIIYAEEAAPEEYRNNLRELYMPLSIAVKLAYSPQDDPIPDAALASPEEFAHFLLRTQRGKWAE